MNKRKILTSRIIFLCMMAFLLSSFAFQASAQTITIYWDQVKQEIDGFGGSAAFKQADNLKKFPTATRTEILDLLFSQTTGIGLSMVRNMVGDGSMSEWGNDIDGPIETIEPENGVWNFDAVDEQIWFMKEAEARGCTRFYSTVWSPPRWMKDNNSCINGGSVLTSMYDEYAEYLYQYVHEYMQNRNNITIYAISVANEPNLSTSYSSCRWSGDQFRTLIRDYVGPRFEGSNTKIIVGEDSNWTEDPAVPTLNDSAAAQYLDIVAAHNYGGSNYHTFSNAQSKNKRVWQTEVSNLGNNDSSMTDGMKWAKQIHNFLTNAEGNSWCYWWTICYKVNPAKGEALININTSNNTYFTNKRLYTMGNYSKFVKPGWYRLSTSTSSSNGVLVTAFKNTSTNDFAIVAINENGSSQTRSFSLDGHNVNSVIPHVTSSSSDLAQGSAISVSNGTFSVSLPGNSVTTFTAPVTDLGDVNNDGTIDIIDALLIAQYYVGLNPSGFDISAADVDCDGGVDIVDALLVAQYYVELVTSFC